MNINKKQWERISFSLLFIMDNDNEKYYNGLNK